MYTNYVIWLCSPSTFPSSVRSLFFIWSKKLFCMPYNQNPIKTLFQLSPLQSNDCVDHPYLLYSCLIYLLFHETSIFWSIHRLLLEFAVESGISSTYIFEIRKPKCSGYFFFINWEILHMTIRINFFVDVVQVRLRVEMYFVKLIILSHSEIYFVFSLMSWVRTVIHFRSLKSRE